jgi:hypothetical protein
MNPLERWLDEAVRWLRVPVGPTTIRWEAINVAVLLVGLVLALWALADVGSDLLFQIRHKRNGANRMLARKECRTEAFRVLRLSIWLATFVAFAVNWDRLILLVAFGPSLYAILEVKDLALNRLVRLNIRSYYRAADEQERARRTELAIRRNLAQPAVTPTEENTHA